MLVPVEMQAAATLGYDAVLWDNGMTPESIASTPWSALTHPLRAAAAVLGYSAAEWNKDGGFDEDEEAQQAPVVAAPPLADPVPNGVRPPAPPAVAAAPVDPPAAVAAAPIEPPSAVAVKGKDKSAWGMLLPMEVQAAATLGDDPVLCIPISGSNPSLAD